MILRLSKIIIAASFLFSLNPFALIFMIPLFIVGICLLWIKSKNIISNILWSILPIIFWYPTLGFLTRMEVLTAQKFDIYFENNYTGKVTIVHSMKCGQPKKVIKGREQLYIPSNGILIYQGTIRPGIVDHHYYDILPNKAIVAIPRRSSDGDFYNRTNNKPPPNLRVAWVGGNGTSTSNLAEPEIEYSYITLAVGTTDSLDLYNESHYDDMFVATIDSVVRACINKKPITKTTHQQGQSNRQ